MNMELSPSPAYQQLHSSLLEQRSRVQSAEIIQLVNRALLAGERVSAAFYDLGQQRQLLQRKSQPLLGHKAEKEIGRFLDELAQLTPKAIADEQQFAMLQRQAARLARQFHWKHASPILVQNALFNRTFLQWQQALDTLFREDNSAETFHRLRRILTDSATKIPVLGEARGLYSLLAELLAACREKAVIERDEGNELASYIAAADIATRGIILFSCTADAVLRARPLPDTALLAAKIAQHHQQVVERTHPWFTAV